MTTDTGAKGKGFWRRRRRKSETEPVVAEPTPAAEPVAEPKPESVTEPTLEPATEPKPAAEAKPESAEEQTSAEESTEPTAAESKPDDDESKPAEDESKATDEASKAEPGDESPAAEPNAEESKDAADPKPAADEPTDESAPEDAAATPPNKSAEGDEPEPADAVDPEPKDENPSEDEDPDDDRPAVGVTYEPEESPDGFPLEYGEIIIGLPKGGEVPESARMVDPQTVATDVPEEKPKKRSSKKAAAKKPEVVAEAPEEPATEPEKEEPATEEAAPADEKPAAEAEDETPAEDAPAPAEEPAAAEEKPAEEAPEEPEVAEATDEAEAKDEPEADAVEDEPAAVEPADEAPAEDSAADEPASEEVADDKAEVAASAVDESAEEPTTEDIEASDEGDSETEVASADEAVDAETEETEETEEEAGAEPEVVLSAEELAAKAAEQQAAMALITALMKLRGALADSKLPLDVVGADEARQQRKAMLDQLDDYVLPRLVQLEAPVLAVVGGSTGAGKSTLVNSLIGQVVSEPGVLRPTTRSPVLIHHPDDAEWFAGDRVLPGMARSSGDSPGGMEDPGQIRLVAADTIPRGLAVLDAPDIDSVVEANRDLATQLLAAADLWLFVTTAARYADAVPWEFLQSASDRSTAVAVVLDRAPADTIDDITGHLAQMLLERGLGDSPLFSIKETVVDERGMLPTETVASIKDWLIDLAADAEARSAVVRRTLQGAVTAMTKKTPAFSKAVRDQADTFVELRANAETAYERAVKDIAKATQDGTMLRGEVLARWQEFVGTGELLKGLQTNVGRMRDKVRASIVGKPPPTRDLNDAVESGLESLLREHAEAAAERAEESWQSTAAGRQLLAAGERDLGRMSKDFPAAASRAVREWQGQVLDLVRKEGADKRSTARILAYGVNGLGLSLMVVIFASTAGITGAEVGVGAGTAVVGQKLLEAVFGDQAVRTLAAKARQDLDDRVHALMDAEFARYLAVLDQHPVDPEAPRQLTEAARAVEDCT